MHPMPHVVSLTHSTAPGVFAFDTLRASVAEYGPHTKVEFIKWELNRPRTQSHSNVRHLMWHAFLGSYTPCIHHAAII